MLVKINFKHDNRNHPLVITLNGKDVSSAFRPGADPNTLVGLVTGLIVGKNALRVQGNGSSGIKDQTLEVTNYPITGPITSGPHQVPFICQTDSFRLYPNGPFYGPATDANCSAPTKITYLYLPVGGTAFIALPSTSSLPADVAKTGWDAMNKGEPAVIHGIKNKLQVAAADVMTDAQTAKMHRAQAEPGSGSE